MPINYPNVTHLLIIIQQSWSIETYCDIVREPYIWFEAGPYIVVNGDCDGDDAGYDGWCRWFGDANEAIWVMLMKQFGWWWVLTSRPMRGLILCANKFDHQLPTGLLRVIWYKMSYYFFNFFLSRGIFGRAPTVGDTFKAVPQLRLAISARIGRHMFSQQMRLPCNSNWEANPIKSLKETPWPVEPTLCWSKWATIMERNFAYAWFS